MTIEISRQGISLLILLSMYFYWMFIITKQLFENNELLREIRSKINK